MFVVSQRWLAGSILAVCTVLSGALGAACGPVRTGGFEVVLPDATDPADTGEGDAGEGSDTGSDARRDGAVDAAPACVDTECDDQCVALGALVGVCRMGMCQCRGLPDGGVLLPEAGAADANVRDVVVRGCASNEECPPSMFCNATSCEGTGFCAFRGEASPTACPSTGSPSCGCDGRLYPNVCMRLATGVRQAPLTMCGSASPDAGASPDASPSPDAGAGPEAGGADASAGD